MYYEHDSITTSKWLHNKRMQSFKSKLWQYGTSGHKTMTHVYMGIYVLWNPYRFTAFLSHFQCVREWALTHTPQKLQVLWLRTICFISQCDSRNHIITGLTHKYHITYHQSNFHLRKIKGFHIDNKNLNKNLLNWKSSRAKVLKCNKFDSGIRRS